MNGLVIVIGVPIAEDLCQQYLSACVEQTGFKVARSMELDSPETAARFAEAGATAARLLGLYPRPDDRA